MKYLVLFSLFIGILNIFLSKLFCSIDKCVINNGIAFGISIRGGVVITFFLILFLLYIGWKVKKDWGVVLGSVGILGFSNLICRLIFGGVPDYLHFFSISFNIADIFIVLFSVLSGVLILLNDKMVVTMNINIQEKYIGRRVDVLISEILKDKSLTRNIVQRYLEKGCTVNGKVCKRSYKLKEGDLLYIDENYWDSVKRDLDLSNEILPQKGKLDIRYEDENLIVLYKPKGLVVHPGVGNREGTLANFLREYLEGKGEYDTLLDRCGIVHRLDKGVSGLIVVAKNKGSQDYLKSQFKNHSVIKIYRAELEESKNIQQNLDINKYLKELNIELQPWKSWEKVEGYIGRSSVNRYKMEFKKYEFGGSKYALSYLKFFDREVLIKIDTGRMHQIRSTLEYLGFHIKGDCLYGKGSDGNEIVMLESVILSFLNRDGKRLNFTV